MPRRALAALAVVALAACSPGLQELEPVPASERRRIDLCEGACRDSIAVTYLGVSGFVIRHRDGALMTAPSFTHRSLWRTLLPVPFDYRPDTALVDAMLRGQQLTDVGAILVGHAHYDHLLDVPYVARRWTPDATIHGSRTMANLLAGEPSLRARTRVVADSAGRASAPGRWIYPRGGGLRFMPLESSHAPNVWPYTFADGRVESPRSSLPRTARGWLKGEVYAWLIDVIAPDSTPLLRFYYQDAAADSQFVVLPPMAGRDARGVDVAILCVGNYGEVADNPQVLLGALQPRYVILSHWEDFFRSPLDPLRVVPRTDTRELVARLRGAVGNRWMTPEPMARITVQY